MPAISDPERDSIAQDHRRMVHRALMLLREADEPWSMGDLAEESGLSPFYFSRIFRDVTGIPPNEFQTALRFDRAKELLLRTDAPVTDICFDVGYGSLGTFSSRFRKLVGLSPAEFRNLPELVDGIDFHHEVINRHPRAGSGSASINGVTMLPPDFQGRIFIGIFPSRLPASAPLAGLMIPRPGSFELPGIPRGSWTLLACAMQDTGDPIAHLLPTRSMMVAAGGDVEVVAGNERFVRPLAFRPPDPLEPPILTALTGLLL